MAFQAASNGTQIVADGTPPEAGSSAGRTRRMRARKACEPCRERKRRCDGSNPCANCVRYEYDCSYVSVRKSRSTTLPPVPPQPRPPPLKQSPPELLTSTGAGAIPSPSVDTETHPLEANSNVAFVRRLTLAIDPANAPRAHLFAWNLFMGARTLNLTTRRRPITDIISRQTMESLANVYLASVDPCYGFIDREALQQRIQACWEPRLLANVYDPVLCGIAALGYLFSRVHVEQAELDILETAKFGLEQDTEQPSIDGVTGWVLRVAYLRMTATPHVAWMASCSLMHIIDASGILFPSTSSANPGITVQQNRSALGDRLFGMARHLNIWMSYDLGRSRVALTQAKPATPTERPGEFTTELLNLLPVSEQLDPRMATNVAQLRNTLWDVIGGKHSQPPSVLAQTNVALCIYRRLRALDFQLSGSLLDAVLALTSRGTVAAQTMLDVGNPWHHVANVPFQILCVLLAIDTAQSLAQIGDAMKALSNAVNIYNTPATTEALNTARLLILLHQRRKDQDAKQLSDTLRAFKPLPIVESNIGGAILGNDSLNTFEDTSWLDSLMMDMPNLQGFDAGNLLEDNFQTGLQNGWM